MTNIQNIIRQYKIDMTLVDWESIEKEISKHYIKGQSVDGRESYSGLILFKMLLLQSWYGLSDTSTGSVTVLRQAQ